MSQVDRKRTYFFVGAFATLQVLFLAFLVSGSALFLFATPEELNTWRYTQLLDAIAAQSIEHVDFNLERTTALVTTKDGETVRVNLPNDPDLEALLAQNNIDVTTSATESPRLFGGHLVLLSVVFITIAIALLGSILWIWMLIDCALQEPNVGNTKIVWTLIIIFTAWVGALAYLLLRRPQRQRELRQ